MVNEFFANHFCFYAKNVNCFFQSFLMTSTTALQLRKENQAIKDEIAQIQKELTNPEEFNIENISLVNYQIDNENDIPEIQNIKSKIIKALEVRDNLTLDYEYLLKHYNKICQEKQIDQADYANVEKDYQQVQINIENAEKNLFSKMEESKYETSERKKGKIKNLLKENYNLRVSKLRIIEELRVKRDLLAKLQKFIINKKQNFDHSKDEAEKSMYVESEKFIRSKVATSVSSRQKLLELKKDIESIEFLKTIPDETLNSKESKRLKNSINFISENLNAFESAKKSSKTEPYTKFLEKLAKKKNELNLYRSDLYEISLKSLQQQLTYAETKYQVLTEKKEITVNHLKKISQSLRKFKEEIEKDFQKLNALNSHLEDENKLFKSSKNTGKINQAIGAKNDQYKLSCEEMENMKFSHQGQINKICYMLNIPIMGLNESPNFAYRRIMSAIREIKMIGNDFTLDPEGSIQFFKMQNENLNKIIDETE